MCPSTTAWGTSCGAASSLGTLSIGGNASATGSLPVANNESWFSVVFSQNTNLSYHPHVLFTSNPSGEFAFDVLSNCSGAVLTCPDQSNGPATTQREWEVKYTAGDSTSPGFVPIPSQAVWIRVYRAAGAANCDEYTLSVSN